jgi:molybdenum cofactor biosynthesis protein B
MAWADHRQNLPNGLRFVIAVTSDTIVSKRSRGEPFQDVSGEMAQSLLREAGHLVAERIYLPNNVEAIRRKIESAVSQGSVDVVVISGGTGVGPKDLTPEAISPLIERALPGFGELFRRLSFESVGTAAISSRAMAGVSKGVLLFALPGSPDAVRLALERIILPESPHLIKMIRG